MHTHSHVWWWAETSWFSSARKTRSFQSNAGINDWETRSSSTRKARVDWCGIFWSPRNSSSEFWPWRCDSGTYSRGKNYKTSSWFVLFSSEKLDRERSLNFSKHGHNFAKNLDLFFRVSICFKSHRWHRCICWFENYARPFSIKSLYGRFFAGYPCNDYLTWIGCFLFSCLLYTSPSPRD